MTATHVWRVRTKLPERFGQLCRVLVRSKRMNSALVEFEDGYKVITSRNYVRKSPRASEPLVDMVRLMLRQAA